MKPFTWNFLCADVRDVNPEHADPGGFAVVNFADQAHLTRDELEVALKFPGDDIAICVDGFGADPCPYEEGPVFVVMTLNQHEQALALLNQ